MNKYKVIASVSVAVALMATIVIFSKNQNTSSNEGGISNNVTVAQDKQIIKINAKGGYAPRKTIANANTPTVIEVETKGTYDCSSALVIPSLNYEKSLPSSGVTEIEVPPQKAGTKLAATCSMGMYGFDIRFQ